MSPFASLLFYIFMFGLSSALLYVAGRYLHGQRKKIIIAAGLIIPIAIAGLRYGVGIDYWSYDTKFGIVDQSSIASLIGEWGSLHWNYMEPSFFIISKITGLITDSSWLTFSVYALISILFFYLGLRRLDLKYGALAFFLFLALFFPQSFNAVRQFAALAILFYATIMLVKYDRKMSFLGWSILAFLFHYTAVVYISVCIIIYILNRNKNNKMSNILQMIVIPSSVLIAVTTVFLLAKNGILTEKAKIMVEGATKTSISVGAWLSTLLNNSIKLVATLPFYNRITKQHKDSQIYFLLFAIGTSMFFLMPISHILFFRISLYFTVFFIVILGYLLETVKKKKNRVAFIILLVIFAIASFTRANYLNDSMQIIPYETIFTKEAA